MIKVAAHREGKTLHQKLAEFGTDGIQGPTFYNFQTGELIGTKRMHDTTLSQEQQAKMGLADGPQGANVVQKWVTHFKSQTGRVNIQKHPWSLYSDFWEWLSPKDDELWFSAGRINEIWQSGYDDVERRPYCTQRWPENWVEIHPDDAKARGIESGDQVMMYSDRVAAHVHTIHGVHGKDFQFSELTKNGHIELSKAAVTAVAIVTPAVKKGMLYSNMIDMRQPSNALAARVVDQISGNYNYKMGVARIKKIGESQYKKKFRSFSWAPRNIV
jgi:arsenite oxidase large subunit